MLRKVKQGQTPCSNHLPANFLQQACRHHHSPGCHSQAGQAQYLHFLQHPVDRLVLVDVRRKPFSSKSELLLTSLFLIANGRGMPPFPPPNGMPPFPPLPNPGSNASPPVGMPPFPPPAGMPPFPLPPGPGGPGQAGSPPQGMPPFPPPGGMPPFPLPGGMPFPPPNMGQGEQGQGPPLGQGPPPGYQGPPPPGL